MRSKDICESLRTCGRFFLFLVALSVGLACINVYDGNWGTALRLVPGMIIFGAIAWCALGGVKSEGLGPAHGSDTSEAGKPVPVGPTPRHHLVAAKELPPSDKTHSFPRD